jgi:hypothetical protein
VRDEQVGQAVFALQPPQQVHDLRAHTHIQSRNRLVEDQQPGPQRQRAGDVDALPLPAAELVRMASQRRLVEADLI